MASNRGVTLWLPFRQAAALLEALEHVRLDDKATAARDVLRQAVASHRLGHTRRTKMPLTSIDKNGDY